MLSSGEGSAQFSVRMRYALREVADGILFALFDAVFRLFFTPSKKDDNSIRDIAIVVRMFDGGTQTDCDLLEKILVSYGYKVKVYKFRERSWGDFLRRKKLADLVIFTSVVHKKWLNAGRWNVVIPNQEWIYPRNVWFLKYMDCVFCKSRHARARFEEMGYPARYVAFSSPDISLDQPESDHDNFLHIAGVSPLKGTRRILEIWSRHPEWPKLTVCTRLSEFYEGIEAPNIEILSHFVPEDELRGMQNRVKNHICTSWSEGFGHYIMEAMCTGAVTLTTNGPPMNELICEGCGVLVDIAHTRVRNLGYDFLIDDADFERKIERVIAMEEAERREIGRKARERYEAICRKFESELPKAVKALSGT